MYLSDIYTDIYSDITCHTYMSYIVRSQMLTFLFMVNTNYTSRFLA